MKNREGKTETGGEKRNMIWSIRDLDIKGLGQNKVQYSSSGVKLPIVKVPL